MEWRSVGDAVGYEVSDCGDVRSIDRDVIWKRRGIEEIRTYKGRVLKPFLTNKGYFSVVLSVGNERIVRFVHRLVGQAFIPLADGKLHINHKNGITTDNRVCNLEWVTPSENQYHRARALCKAVGESHYKAKLTESDVSEIRAAVAGGATQLSMAKKFEVSAQQIHRIVKNKSWATESPP